MKGVVVTVRSQGLVAALVLLGAALPAAAQAPAPTQTIYTCVDAKGKRYTADRPIMECNDREQNELNASGTLRRKVAPPMTALERTAQEDAARKLADEQNRANDEKKRDRALIARYPAQPAHDRERAAALAQIDGVIASARKRTAELVDERKKLDAEGEFFKTDPAKMPAKLKRSMDENTQAQAGQARLQADRVAERQRISTRFDDELARLRKLWSPQLPATAALSPTTAAATKQP